MTFEIKNRIEKINNGEVPDGYKRTKVGIVPVDWKEISFSDLFTITSDYTDDLNKYPLCSLTIENGIIPKTERYERSYLVKKENAYKIVRPNDFVYNPMNVRFGAVSRYKGKSEISVSGYYDIFTAKINSDSKFMDSFLVSDKMIAYYNKVSIGSLVEKQRVHISQFLNFTIPLPTSGERKEIAEILETQDKIIELKERKIEELKKLKKYYLSKMFPKRGSNYPEVRFPGFTDPWEQRKVSELLEERNEQYAKSEEYPLMAFIANKGVSPKGERYDRSALINDTENKLYKRTEYGDFIYSSNNLETGSIGLNKYGNACISPVYSIFKPTGIADSDFIGRRFVRKDFINNMIKWRQGVIYGQWRIHESDFLKIKVVVPEIEEQRKIGVLLDKFDNLITLHQRELEEEKQKKKALAQLLLTGIVRV